jgi:hypothetical protein
VKGCIINYDKTSLIEVFGCMNDFDKCNCLITNIECCHADMEYTKSWMRNTAGLMGKSCCAY